jgi:hypothetical protein
LARGYPPHPWNCSIAPSVLRNPEKFGVEGARGRRDEAKHG